MEQLRSTGGVMLHTVAESWGALCGYFPSLGWAAPEARDKHRLECRECARLAQIGRPAAETRSQG